MTKKAIIDDIQQLRCACGPLIRENCGGKAQTHCDPHPNNKCPHCGYPIIITYVKPQQNNGDANNDKRP
jgi:hypothetical protein